MDRKKNTVVKRCLCCDVGCRLPCVRATAAAAGCVLAHAVTPDGSAPARVPPQTVVVGFAGVRVTADAVYPTSPVPASECAFGECATTVSAGAWKFESNRACHSFTSVFFLYLQCNLYNARCQ